MKEYGISYRYPTIIMASIFLWIGFVGNLTMAQSPAAQTPAGSPGPDQYEELPSYVIQPNDVLEIFVWKEPELSRKVLVRPDGRISFPLAQDFQAAGLTPEELTRRVEGLLKDYLEAPMVTVIVDQIQHYRIYVTGNVHNPGSFSMEEPITVLQALSLAGSFGDFADTSKVQVVRVVDGENQFIRFNYKEFIEGKNTDQNIQLQSGDVVVVP